MSSIPRLEGRGRQDLSLAIVPLSVHEAAAILHAGGLAA